jgi:signal transduction histidine kinase
VPQDPLGLFDTPPDRRQVRLALALVALLFAALVILSFLPQVRLRRIDAFVPMIDAIMFIGDLITATLLYVQASIFRSRALTVLASGYALTALLLVAHVLTFPGAFAPDGLLGAQLNTTAWIANFWRAATPISIILYVVLKRAEATAQPATEPRTARIATGIFGAVALAGGIVLLATRGHALLPHIFINRYDVDYTIFLWVNSTTTALVILALAVLIPIRKSVLDMWLQVALAGWLASALVNIQATGRFTVSFYSQFGLLLFAHFVLMLVLIAETNRLYARLALSTAARERERDARMMSMDAITAAIAHEVGQPLTGAITNAMAGLCWLKRERPDHEKAIEALRATIDSGNRTNDVIKSIRAMFAKESTSATEFSLNDLVRETASFHDRELAGEKVSLELTLDEELPPILADRVQIQRVLVNLFTNAIESLGATRGRARRIAVRSAPLNGGEVLLEVSDTGIGFRREEALRIFDAFFTTKATGTGLGLSLCRTIVEEHGGRLWASPGIEHGAVFHLQLPRGGTARGLGFRQDSH